MPEEEGARRIARAVHRAELVVFDEDHDVLYVWNGSATIRVVGLDGQDVDVAGTMEAMDRDQARRMIDRMIAGEDPE